MRCGPWVAIVLFCLFISAHTHPVVPYVAVRDSHPSSPATETESKSEVKHPSVSASSIGTNDNSTTSSKSHEAGNVYGKTDKAPQNGPFVPSLSGSDSNKSTVIPKESNKVTPVVPSKHPVPNVSPPPSPPPPPPPSPPASTKDEHPVVKSFVSLAVNASAEVSSNGKQAFGVVWKQKEAKNETEQSTVTTCSNKHPLDGDSSAASEKSSPALVDKATTPVKEDNDANAKHPVVASIMVKGKAGFKTKF